MQLRLYLLLIPFALSACEQLGLDDQAKITAAREADGRAIGSACRQSARALEDCYSLNPKSQKAAIFAGWRFKFVLVARAAFNQGFALPRLPVRGTR